MDNSSSFQRITHSQEKMHLEKTIEAEISEDNHVSDSDDNEYFLSHETAASDCYDTADEIALNEDDEKNDVAAKGLGMRAKNGTQWAATPSSEDQISFISWLMGILKIFILYFLIQDRMRDKATPI
ncbi:Protein of unknown function [Cotesia congregata]|uniref:Uncharacterized protein n=1 Tax=Cotesia congregata TaxID=51543 RepID=A0A8J2HHY7_COTCN|nr:Protein of unknown function [Cotesia congregata]